MKRWRAEEPSGDRQRGPVAHPLVHGFQPAARIGERSGRAADVALPGQHGAPLRALCGRMAESKFGSQVWLENPGSLRNWQQWPPL